MVFLADHDSILSHLDSTRETSRSLAPWRLGVIALKHLQCMMRGPTSPPIVPLRVTLVLLYFGGQRMERRLCLGAHFCLSQPAWLCFFYVYYASRI